MTYCKHLNAIVGVVILFLLSILFASRTMLQTLLGATTLILFLTLLMREIWINNKQLKRTHRRICLSYGVIFFSLLLFNASVHQTFFSTFGQTDIDQFWGEHESTLHMNGKTYSLIWTTRSFLSTVYFYNLYERRGLFFCRVNAKVISYKTNQRQQTDRGAVKTFLYYREKKKLETVD